VHPCYKTTIVLVFLIGAQRVDVTAKAAATIGGVSYPAGDVVASYRVLVPEQWRFEVRFEFDPRCCDKVPEQPPQGATTDWEPGWNWEWNPGLDWKFKPGFKLRLDYDIPYHESDEERRERLRREFRLRLEYRF